MYCRNPACPNPENPDSNKYCGGCGLELAVPPLFANHYEVTKVLGEGAFGRTYLAKNKHRFDTPCVIKKFIAQGQGIKAKQLFEQEGRSLYQLEHPQIPHLYAYFEQDNSLYLVQQYIDGENLLKELLRKGPFSEAKIRQLLQDLLPVLQYIHQRKLLHRDIKPENIMRRTEDDKLILIDFGGVKLNPGTVHAQTGTVLYTPGYGAIEHIMGKPRRASDIYSLGATCVRLLTGCITSWDSQGNFHDELYDTGRVRWLWRERLQDIGGKVSPSLEMILDKMLQHSAEERYQSVEEVLQDLNSQSRRRGQSTTSQSQGQSQQRSRQQSSQTLQQQTTITRAEFLKFAGFAGVGVIATLFIGSLFSGNDSPEKESEPSEPNNPSSPVETLSSPETTTNTFSFEIITVDERGKEIDRRPGEAEYIREVLGNGVDLDLVKIPGGTFMMGSPSTEEKRDDDEEPRHQVTISPFYMAKYQITQAQWEAVMGNNPADFKGANRPVEKVSWFDAVEFCQKLSDRTGKEFRLPTEAEWEYACRAGTSTPFHFGATITTKLANYYGESTYASAPEGKYRKETTDVGSFPPNAFGLYDMHGNVWEWCYDQWHDNYNNAPSDGSVWLIDDNDNDNHYRLLRGGSWYYYPRYCRSAERYGYAPDLNWFIFGLRVVLSL